MRNIGNAAPAFARWPLEPDDPLSPSQVRYRAALRSEPEKGFKS